MRTGVYTLVAALFSISGAGAQEKPDSYLEPYHTDSTNWIPLTGTEFSRFEYDKTSVKTLDSEHFSIWLRDKPLAAYGGDPRRSISRRPNDTLEDYYSDSLRVHPLFNYEGFECYGYTIFKEVIDRKKMRYRILHVQEYSTHNQMLSNYTAADTYWTLIAGKNNPEGALVYLYSKNEDFTQN